jgi:hypothetical protein
MPSVRASGRKRYHGDSSRCKLSMEKTCECPPRGRVRKVYACCGTYCWTCKGFISENGKSDPR